MKLSPFMKQVEIDGGYKGFYKYGSQKVNVTVESNGIGVYVDTRTGLPRSGGRITRLFKPMPSLWAGKKYAESLGEVNPQELVTLGFVELSLIDF